MSSRGFGKHAFRHADLILRRRKRL